MGLLELRGYRSSDRNVTYWDSGGNFWGRKCLRAKGLDHKRKVQRKKKKKENNNNIQHPPSFKNNCLSWEHVRKRTKSSPCGPRPSSVPFQENLTAKLDWLEDYPPAGSKEDGEETAFSLLAPNAFDKILSCRFFLSVFCWHQVLLIFVFVFAFEFKLYLYLWQYRYKSAVKTTNQQAANKMEKLHFLCWHQVIWTKIQLQVIFVVQQANCSSIEPKS